MKKTVFAAVAGVAAISGAASAQESGISNPRGIVANFDAVNLGPVLTELGVVWQSAQTADGKPFIKASVGQNEAFMIVPHACADAVNSVGCVGANIFILYDGLNPNPQTVSAFNQNVPFVSAGVFSGSSVAFISRYEIADYGIPRGNVASSIGNFLYAAGQFRSQLSGANTVSLDGYADDMLASGLNAQSATVMSVSAPTVQSPDMLHRAGFAEAPLVMKQMLESDVAPVNKITNITGK
jgi:hypothetical protein